MLSNQFAPSDWIAARVTMEERSNDKRPVCPTRASLSSDIIWYKFYMSYHNIICFPLINWGQRNCDYILFQPISCRFVHRIHPAVWLKPNDKLTGLSWKCMTVNWSVSDWSVGCEPVWSCDGFLFHAEENVTDICVVSVKHQLISQTLNSSPMLGLSSLVERCLLACLVFVICKSSLLSITKHYFPPKMYLHSLLHDYSLL